MTPGDSAALGLPPGPLSELSGARLGWSADPTGRGRRGGRGPRGLRALHGDDASPHTGGARWCMGGEVG